jgi:hypothetical protein
MIVAIPVPVLRSSAYGNGGINVSRYLLPAAVAEREFGGDRAPGMGMEQSAGACRAPAPAGASADVCPSSG